MGDQSRQIKWEKERRNRNRSQALPQSWCPQSVRIDDGGTLVAPHAFVAHGWDGGTSVAL